MRLENIAGSGISQNTVVLFILITFFFVLTMLIVPHIAREHEAALQRDSGRKATQS